MCWVSRQAGHRFGEHVERMVPLIERYSREEDDELREYCLQAFEAIVQRCPKEVTPHIDTVSTNDKISILLSGAIYFIQSSMIP